MKKAQEIALPGAEGKTIYGLFDQAESGKSSSLVILAHGLAGRVRGFVHITAARAFTAAGYDVARISFYSGSPNARRLRDCTVALHARDLNDFVDHFRPKYTNIFIAGHSYGGFSLLFANPAVNAVSFWDSTYTPGWHREVPHVPEIDCFTFNNGQESLIGRAMYEEAVYYDANPPADKAARFQSPAQVVLARQDGEKPGRNRQELFNALGVADKELVKIDEADHQFTNGHTTEELIKATKSWFDGHLRV